jgi:hypothetical protein
MSVAGGAVLLDDACGDATARGDLDSVRLGPAPDRLRVNIRFTVAAHERVCVVYQAMCIVEAVEQ